jgi:hypothetical protein
MLAFGRRTAKNYSLPSSLVERLLLDWPPQFYFAHVPYSVFTSAIFLDLYLL